MNDFLKEDRTTFLARLRRATGGLNKSFLDRARANMRDRCPLLYRAKGGHFEEGGR